MMAFPLPDGQFSSFDLDIHIAPVENTVLPTDIGKGIYVRVKHGGCLNDYLYLGRSYIFDIIAGLRTGRQSFGLNCLTQNGMGNSKVFFFSLQIPCE